jgi:hypothetical protein
MYMDESIPCHPRDQLYRIVLLLISFKGKTYNEIYHRRYTVVAAELHRIHYILDRMAPVQVLQHTITA